MDVAQPVLPSYRRVVTYASSSAAGASGYTTVAPPSRATTQSAVLGLGCGGPVVAATASYVPPMARSGGAPAAPAVAASYAPVVRPAMATAGTASTGASAVTAAGGSLVASAATAPPPVVFRGATAVAPGAAAVKVMSNGMSIPLSSCTLLPAPGPGDAAAGPLLRAPRASERAGNKATTQQLRAISLEYQQAELIAATDNWHPSQKLGAGCCGAVFRGELKDGTEVAIKVIELKAAATDEAGFEEEVLMLSKFRHPNLVTLLGWAHQGHSRYLVYEYLSGGDVFQRLHRRTIPFYAHQRLSVLTDAATGLSHMHNSTPKAFHRDIKSANVLLDRHGTAKMADFGLSCCASGRMGDRHHVTDNTISGTPGYKCPIYERTARFTEGSEVYSFGMVMLEVLTGMHPSKHDSKCSGGIGFPISDTLRPQQVGALQRCVQHQDREAGWVDVACLELAALALKAVDAACSDADHGRPLFRDVVRALRGIDQPVVEIRDVSRPPRPEFPQPRHSPLPAAAAPEGSSEPALAQPWAGSRQPQQPSPDAAAAVADAVRPWAVMPAAKRTSYVPSLPVDAGCSAPQQMPIQGARRMDAASPRSRPQDLEIQPPAASPPAASPPARGIAAASPEAGWHARATRPSFCLECIYAPTGVKEALPQLFRYLPLIADESILASANGKLSAPVGRAHQARTFEAWMPDSSSRACTSRRAFDVLWPPDGGAGAGGGAADDDVWLLGGSLNPISVDGRVVAKNSQARLKIGSEIRLTYDFKILLGLRLQRLPADFDLDHWRSVAHGSAGVAAAAFASDVVAVPRPLKCLGGGGDSGGGDARVLAGPSARGVSGGGGFGDGSLTPGHSPQPAAPSLAASPVLRQASVSGCMPLAGGAAALAPHELQQLAGYAQTGPPARSVSTIAAPSRDARPTSWAEHADGGGGRLGACGGDAEDVVVVMPDAVQKVVLGHPAVVHWEAERQPHRAWALALAYSDGCPRDGMRPELSTISLKEGVTNIGRQHQPRHFAVWLRDQSLLFQCIADSHLRLVLSSSGRMGITSLSSACSVFLGQSELCVGQTLEVALSTLVRFSRPGTSLGEAFLVLRLTGAAESSSASQDLLVGASEGFGVDGGCSTFDVLGGYRGCGGRGEAPSFSTVARARDVRASDGSQYVLPAPSPLRAAEAPEQLEVQGQGESHAMRPLRASPAASLVDSSAHGAAAESARVRLELRGEGTLDVPVEWREIVGTLVHGGMLQVGRNHQQDLHNHVVNAAFQQYVAGDQFCIVLMHGEFWLCVMTELPTFLDRSFERQQLLKDQPRVLMAGDEVLLGPGLSWHFDGEVLADSLALPSTGHFTV